MCIHTSVFITLEKTILAFLSTEQMNQSHFIFFTASQIQGKKYHTGS